VSAEDPGRPHIRAVGRQVEAAQPGQPELRLDAVQRLTPELQAEIDRLAEAARAVDGVRPFGEHKWLRLVRGDDRCAALLLRRGEELVGAAHCDVYHVGPASGACRVTAELVVHPNSRGQGLGRRLLAGALDLARDEWADHLHLWAYGNLPRARRLARAFDVQPERALLQYSLARDRLPLAADLPAGVRLRAFEPSSGTDAAAWLELHNRVFAEHPEQGAWEPADFEARLEQSWFDPRDLLLAEDTATGALVGFCWVKIPCDEVSPGEIYIVGIDPARRGQGLGRALTQAGLAHIRARGRPGAMLYVEANNQAAIRLYEGLGFEPLAEHVCYTRPLRSPTS
jgi:mycothiol synthase